MIFSKFFIIRFEGIFNEMSFQNFRHNGIQWHTKYTEKEGIFQKFLEKNQTLFHRTIKSFDQTGNWPKMDMNRQQMAHIG